MTPRMAVIAFLMKVYPFFSWMKHPAVCQFSLIACLPVPHRSHTQHRLQISIQAAQRNIPALRPSVASSMAIMGEDTACPRYSISMMAVVASMVLEGCR